jgi:hypothetical protein
MVGFSTQCGYIKGRIVIRGAGLIYSIFIVIEPQYLIDRPESVLFSDVG